MTTTVTPPDRTDRSAGPDRSRTVDLAKPTRTERTAVRTGARRPPRHPTEDREARQAEAVADRPDQNCSSRSSCGARGIAHLILAAKTVQRAAG